jgi:hypothetical protein
MEKQNNKEYKGIKKGKRKEDRKKGRMKESKNFCF